MSLAPPNEQSSHTTAGEPRLDRLQELLCQQLELVRQSSLTAAMKLCEQTDQCVQVIAANRTQAWARDGSQVESSLDVPGSADQWQCIERLYKELCLTLAAPRAEAS